MIEDSIKSPGVYVDEIDAFPNSVVPVATAVPAFIGYTPKAEHGGTPLTGEPVPVQSLADFEAMFGGASGDGFGMHEAVSLFYENGGGTAIILSVGPPGDVRKSDFLDALTTLEHQLEPAILLAPDALRLPPDDYHEVARAMIAHCAELGSRMAILDLHGGDAPEAGTVEGLKASIAAFRAAMARVPEEQRSYAAAYHPWLLTANATVPPSAAMAGLWAQTDNMIGVWKAPANVSVAGAADVAFRVSDTMQEDMNVPADGLAVNAIRFFNGRGVLVWGARTLAGNDQDFRYVPVRRTVILVEQSVRQALPTFVFQPNDPTTWAAVAGMVQNFLNRLWREGALPGSKPQDAFAVKCGLDTTMTAADIEAGTMRVELFVAPIRPAEFIVFVIEQAMAPG